MSDCDKYYERRERTVYIHEDLWTSTRELLKEALEVYEQCDEIEHLLATEPGQRWSESIIDESIDWRPEIGRIREDLANDRQDTDPEQLLRAVIEDEILEQEGENLPTDCELEQMLPEIVDGLLEKAGAENGLIEKEHRRYLFFR
ncbi:MAG: hypothetical protein ABEJ02_04665 [Candidatus Paceibacteria bacterium]